jgi:hypothetical protein
LGLRITVPGPLRFRRLAVPQTSWNLIHYAPDALFRQRISEQIGAFSSVFILLVFNPFRSVPRECLVDKTFAVRGGFAIL